MREMRDSGFGYIGQIPQAWSIGKLKQFFEKSNVTNHPDDTVLSLYRDYGVIPKDSRDDNHNVTSLDTSKYKHVDVGDFVINKMKGWQGSMALSPYEGIVSPAYHVFKFRSSELYPKYAHYLLRCRSFADEWRRLSTGLRVGQWDLHVEDFLNTCIPHPPLDEQRRIADYLDARCADIDAAIRAAEKSIEDYKAFRDVSISTVAIHGLRNTKTKPSGVPGVGNIPADWGTPSAGILFSENVRPALPNDQQLTLSQTDGLIPTAETITQGLRTGTYENWRHVIPGDLVLNRFKAHLGVFFASKYTGMVSFHYGVFVPQQSLNVKYYEYLFHSDAFRQEFALSSNGVTVGLQNLSNTNFYHTRCLLPPIDEQNEIVDYLDRLSLSINGMTSAKQSIIADLKAYKQSLVYEVATGKREVS